MRIIKATWFAVIGVVVSLFVVGAAWALPPRVTWEPERLAPASLARGESATFSVTLKHTGVLPIPATLQLRIVPEGGIVPFVSVTPPVFPPVFKRGNTVTFQVHVTVPANTPFSVMTGKLLLERILPNGTVMDVFRAEALPVELTFLSFSLPPDPGEAGNQTVEGTDSNENGVRDDVERWIGHSYPSSEKTRAAQFQLAGAFQSMIIAGVSGNGSDALNLERSLSNASDCVRYVMDPRGISSQTHMQARPYVQEKKKLLAEMLNTRDRSMAYAEFHRFLAGEVIMDPARYTPGDNRQGCVGFDPDLMRD